MFMPETPPADLRVLIVDDTTCCRQIVCELLERRGYEIAGEAAGVAAALGLAERIQPDAALLDVHLPDGDGFDLAEQLTRSQPGMAVLLTSADFDEHFYAGRREWRPRLRPEVSACRGRARAVLAGQ